jgi:hypothetical protein
MVDMRFGSSNTQGRSVDVDKPRSQGPSKADASKPVLVGVKPDLKAGDERGGFEVTVHKSARILRVRMWGLWDQDLGEQFRSGALKLARNLGRAPWAILADASHFVAQSAEVTQKRKDVMVGAIPLGCTRIAAIVGQAVHSMQFTRIAHESHVASAVFKDEATAVAWIEDGLGLSRSHRTT